MLLILKSLNCSFVFHLENFRVLWVVILGWEGEKAEAEVEERVMGGLEQDPNQTETGFGYRLHCAR